MAESTDENVTSIDSVVDAERQAAAELRKELAKGYVDRIKQSLKRIADAKRILANHELAHRALLADMKAEAGE